VKQKIPVLASHRLHLLPFVPITRIRFSVGIAMFLLIRVLIYLALIAGLAYGALYALGALVEPEPREIVIQVPMPKPRGG
jgi:hypothetical protein